MTEIYEQASRCRNESKWKMLQTQNLVCDFVSIFAFICLLSYIVLHLDDECLENVVFVIGAFSLHITQSWIILRIYASKTHRIYIKALAGSYDQHTHICMQQPKNLIWYNGNRWQSIKSAYSCRPTISVNLCLYVLNLAIVIRYVHYNSFIFLFTLLLLYVFCVGSEDGDDTTQFTMPANTPSKKLPVSLRFYPVDATNSPSRQQIALNGTSKFLRTFVVIYFCTWISNIMSMLNGALKYLHGGNRERIDFWQPLCVSFLLRLSVSSKWADNKGSTEN